MNIKDLELNFARIQFYKPLASKLHPAGAFSLVKTAFLRILNMYNYIVSGFVQYLLTYKFWVSKQHPAGAFSLRKIAFLDFSRMYNSENQSCFSKEVVVYYIFYRCSHMFEEKQLLQRLVFLTPQSAFLYINRN